MNAFFVRSDLAAEKFFRPYTAENHYEPLRLHLIQDASPYEIDLRGYEPI